MKWLTLAAWCGIAGCGGGLSADGSGTDGAGDADADADADAETDTPTEPGTTPPDELTILTLNLHCFKLDGTSYADNDARFAAIAATAAAEDVRAIAAQEACENAVEGVAMARLAAALTAATGEPWGTAWTPTHLAWTGTPDEAQEGVGILVAGGDPADVVALDYAVQGPQERWLLTGRFTTPAGSAVALTTVHLEHDDATARGAQARQTAMFALVHADAAWGTLVAGDFNAVAAEPPVADLEAAGFTRLSAGSDPDGREIDHVFAPTPAGFEVLATRLAFDGAAEPAVSDHPGVLVTLRRGAPTAATVTRFAATHDTGLGHFLALRGDTAPLSWDAGWPAANTAPDRWEAVFLGWNSGTVAYKWLVDDAAWETGDDHAAAVGAAADVTPAF